MLHLTVVSVSNLKPIPGFKNERYLQFKCGGTNVQTSPFVVSSFGKSKINASFDFDQKSVSASPYFKLNLLPTKAFGASLAAVDVQDREVGESLRLNLDKMEQKWRETVRTKDAAPIWEFDMALTNKKTKKSVGAVKIQISFDIPVSKVSSDASSEGVECTKPFGRCACRSCMRPALTKSRSSRSVHFSDSDSDSDDVICEVKTYCVTSPMRRTRS